MFSGFIDERMFEEPSSKLPSDVKPPCCIPIDELHSERGIVLPPTIIVTDKKE